MNPSPNTALAFGRPLLPDRALLMQLLDQAFAGHQLSNGGPLHQRLERALSAQVGGLLCLAASGTTALMMALRLGGLAPGGEVITSPLSFAASVQAIEWCGLKPVFADVEPGWPTLDPRAVQKVINPRTVAILGVHFMGVACDTDALEQLARQHGLWLVFDGAQSPDITQAGQNLALRGDATVLSLHATKLLNTAEGGAVVVRNAAHQARLERMRNFGLADGRLVDIGLNGKMSEIHAAMGLAALPRVAAEMQARQRLRQRYQALLAGVPQVSVLQPRPHTSASHLYFALSMPPALRQRVVQQAATQGIRLRDAFALLCGPGTLYADATITHHGAAALAPQRAQQLMALPMHGDIDDAGAEAVCGLIAACAAEHSRDHP
jgi:dTDP-4-amino-4,6-dideoxygalactose transaminase